MPYILENFKTGETQPFDELSHAETTATQMMDALGFKWCRCETGHGTPVIFEYCKYPATGTPIVYLRISEA
jgi:hypothetical protein